MLGQATHSCGCLKSVALLAVGTGLLLSLPLAAEAACGAANANCVADDADSSNLLQLRAQSDEAVLIYADPSRDIAETDSRWKSDKSRPMPFTDPVDDEDCPKVGDCKDESKRKQAAVLSDAAVAKLYLVGKEGAKFAVKAVTTILKEVPKVIGWKGALLGAFVETMISAFFPSAPKPAVPQALCQQVDQSKQAKCVWDSIKDYATAAMGEQIEEAAYKNFRGKVEGAASRIQKALDDFKTCGDLQGSLCDDNLKFAVRNLCNDMWGDRHDFLHDQGPMQAGVFYKIYAAVHFTALGVQYGLTPAGADREAAGLSFIKTIRSYMHEVRALGKRAYAHRMGKTSVTTGTYGSGCPWPTKTFSDKSGRCFTEFAANIGWCQCYTVGTCVGRGHYCQDSYWANRKPEDSCRVTRQYPWDKEHGTQNLCQCAGKHRDALALSLDEEWGEVMDLNEWYALLDVLKTPRDIFYVNGPFKDPYEANRACQAQDAGMCRIGDIVGFTAKCSLGWVKYGERQDVYSERRNYWAAYYSNKSCGDTVGMAYYTHDTNLNMDTVGTFCCKRRKVTFVDGEFASKEAARAACKGQGRRLCRKRDAEGHQRCANGWLDEAASRFQIGYWMSQSYDGCGSGQGWRWGATRANGAFCCEDDSTWHLSGISDQVSIPQDECSSWQHSISWLNDP